MLAKHLSLASTLIAFASVVFAAPSTTSAAAPKPTVAVPPPLIPLPPFSGTFKNTYPTQDVVAPTDTALAKGWIAAINMTAVPKFPVVPFTANGDPKSPNSVPADACDWTTTNCINKDIVKCPLGVWGLTYDDGPTQFSEQLYDVLDKTDQKATLFYIGSNVVQNWQAARRACGAGHQIAVHTWSHQPSTSLTNEQFVAEVKYTELAIQELCGFTPRYFRPPYGDIDNRIRGLLDQMGYTSVIWDLDTNDWQMAPGGTRTMSQLTTDFNSWVAAAPKDTDGHICLEHELYQNTVNAAISILPTIQKTWKAMPVSACINDAHPYHEQNITLATMDGKAKTGANLDKVTVSSTNANSSSTSSASGAGPSNATAAGKNGTSDATTLTKSSTAMVMVAAIVGQMALTVL